MRYLLLNLRVNGPKSYAYRMLRRWYRDREGVVRRAPLDKEF
jgi:hypothetical protein